MLARVFGLLLAVIMMTGAATQVCASPDVAGALGALGALRAIDDDGPTLDPAVVPEPVVMPLPDRREPVGSCAARSAAPGRIHAVFVFRPPRPVASR